MSTYLRGLLGTLQVRRSGGLFTPRIESLYYINGRDLTPLIHSLINQVETVRRELETV